VTCLVRVTLATAVVAIGLAGGEARAQSNTERGVRIVPAEPARTPAPPVPDLRQREVPKLPADLEREGALPGFAASGPAVSVRRIVVEGATVLNEGSFSAVTATSEGRDLTATDIELLRQQLTLQYVQRGYVNSGVLVAEPAVDAAGVLHFRAVEGRLDAIQVSGNRHLGTGYIRDRIRGQVRPVLSIADLENALRLMQGWPTVAQVKAEILPGLERGSALLDLQVRETDPVSVQFGTNNHRAPSVGETQGVVSAVHRSLTGHGDQLSASYGATDGLADWSVGYSLPLNARDLTVALNYGSGNTDIVEAPFDALEIVSRTDTAGVRLSMPVIREVSQVLAVSLDAERRRSRSTLLGIPFSFSPGEIDGRSTVSAVRLGVDWSRRWTRDAIGVRARYSHGVGLLDSTDNSALPGGLPDSRFSSVLLQAEYAHQFPWRQVQLLARLTAQGSRDPLLPLEKLAIGGAYTVRGYRENQLVRDEGAIGSVELRIPLFVDDSGNVRYGLRLVPFVDYGMGRDRLASLPTARSQELFAGGLGLSWNGWTPLHAAVHYGHRFNEVPRQGNTLQDDGVHFEVAFRWSF
jgi:hemolysin activation/secretion protein